MTRRALLTRNAELRRDGVWNWSLPAWVVELSDGTAFNVCPSAGACKSLCYARNGTYRFPTVRAAHLANLEWTLHDLPGWEASMIEHLAHRRFRPTGTARLPEWVELVDDWMAGWMTSGGAAVRIHDAGDFYSDDYLAAWLRIAAATPDVLFYAYTKEVSRMRRLAPQAPANFRWLYSLGGREDHLLDLDQDRHAEVFPDAGALELAGYLDQSDSDLLAVILPTTRIGIPANNIPAYRRRQGSATFGEMERSLTRHSRREPVPAPRRRSP